jgi:hypothetical protein
MALGLCLILSAGTYFYWTLYDTREFSSTLQLSYALSQAIHLYGPLVMGLAAYVAVRQHRVPDIDLLKSSARGKRAFHLQSILWVSASGAAAYLLGCAAVFITGLVGDHFVNGLSLRILAPVLATPAIVAASYAIGSIFRFRITPALVAVAGYFLMTKPHYYSSRFVELAHVQQRRFTPWFEESTTQPLIFSVWMACLSTFAISFYLQGRVRIAGVTASVVVGAACVTALVTGAWNADDEYQLAKGVKLDCDVRGNICVHPAYRRAVPAFTPALENLNRRMESIGLDSIRVEQTPYAFDPTTDPTRTPVDIFSSTQDAVAISLGESVTYNLVELCERAEDRIRVATALATWLAGTGTGLGNRALVRDVEFADPSARVTSARDVLDVLGC